MKLWESADGESFPASITYRRMSQKTVFDLLNRQKVTSLLEIYACLQHTIDTAMNTKFINGYPQIVEQPSERFWDWTSEGVFGS